MEGKELQLPSAIITAHAALLCISCDSPAMRKVGGFMSHNANKGCYKCTKSFPTASFGVINLITVALIAKIGSLELIEIFMTLL